MLFRSSKKESKTRVVKKRLGIGLVSFTFLCGIPFVEAKTYKNYNVGDVVSVHVNDKETSDFYVIKNSEAKEDKVLAIAKNDSYPKQYTYEEASKKVDEYKNLWTNVGEVTLPKLIDLIGIDAKTICDSGSFTDLKFLYATGYTYWTGDLYDENKMCAEEDGNIEKGYWTISTDLYKTEGKYSISSKEIALAVRPEIQVSKEFIEGGVLEEVTDKPTQDIDTENETKQKVYADGTAIYYNPETNAICNRKDAVSTTGTKTGCMKWYTFNDKGESASIVSLLLDHNTSLKVDWNSSGAKEMREAKIVLQEDTKTWKKPARLITADEIAHIVGADRNDTLKWNAMKEYIPYRIFYQSEDYTLDKNIAEFYLDGSFNIDKMSYSETSGWNKQVASSLKKSRYAWLYDNLLNCKNYGCNVEQYVLNVGLPAGYYTNTTVETDLDSSLVFTVNNKGKLSTQLTARAEFEGIRPVITVEKSILEEKPTSSTIKKCPNDKNIDISACIIGGKTEEECIRMNCPGTEQIHNPKTGLYLQWVILIGICMLFGISTMWVRKNYFSKI